jgi:LysR family transcriptional regulator, regulator of abg operon
MAATMKFNAIRDFLAVSERGSLRAAARHLGSAQPAITRSIQELERELGVTLFERSASGVRLTPMGRTFLRRARTVRGELKKAKEELDQMRGMMQGSVTACLSSVSHLALLPTALPAFRQQFPEVSLNIIDAVYPKIEAELIDGRLDFYVGPTPDNVTRELQVEKLFDNTRVVLCRKGHPLSAARSLEELTQAEWITTSTTHKAEQELGPVFAEHNLPPPRLVMRAQTSLTFIVAMAYSDLLMMLPSQWVTFPLWQDVLTQIKVREPLSGPPMCIVKHAALPLTPAAEYFCDMMRRASHHMESLQKASM